MGIADKGCADARRVGPVPLLERREARNREELSRFAFGCAPAYGSEVRSCGPGFDAGLKPRSSTGLALRGYLVKPHRFKSVGREPRRGKELA